MKITQFLFLTTALLLFFNVTITKAEIIYKPSVGLPITVDGQEFKGCVPPVINDYDSDTTKLNKLEEYQNCGVTISDDKNSNLLGLFIKGLYQYAVGIVGIVSTIVLMWGGVLWIVAGGNAERVGNAKSWITASLTGLVLTFSSYMILSMINEDLINFSSLEIEEYGETLERREEASRFKNCNWLRTDLGFDCESNQTTVNTSYCPEMNSTQQMAKENGFEFKCCCETSSD